MLVLTRRVNEKICLPDIDTMVQVISVKPGVVRLGIEAPREITVLREEKMGSSACQSRKKTKTNTVNLKEKESSLFSVIPDRLKDISITLGLARLQIQAGHTADAQDLLDTLQKELQDWRRQLEGTKKKVDCRPPLRSLPTLSKEDTFEECDLLASCIG